MMASARSLILFAALIVVVATSVSATDRPTPNSSIQPPFEKKVYIVQLDEPPALNFRRRTGPEGIVEATQPANRKRFDPESKDTRRYAKYLTDSHDELLESVGAEKIYSYRYTFNGFAARLTAAQANKLRSQENVLRVWRDEVRHLQTNDSPEFLGLFESPGGLTSDLGLDGEGVIIGVIDSGITPEHPSFEAIGPPLDWNGSCETGEQFDASACNGKIIGARYYSEGFTASLDLDENEFLSPRDADGHGTHIASTAAGNEVRASLAGTDVGRVKGVAPRARIAVYKACWLESGEKRAFCSTSDLQRAIEDAVADGVDIINYSIGDTDFSLSDPDDLALLNAADAGVLTVVAAGNDGPAEGTILSPAGAPWVLTVGASSRTGVKFEEAVYVNVPSDIAGHYVTREAFFTPPLRDVGPVTGPLRLAHEDGSVTDYDACSAPTYSRPKMPGLCESSWAESSLLGIWLCRRYERKPDVIDVDLSGSVAFIQRGGCEFEEKIRNVEAAGAIAAVVFDNQGKPINMEGTRDSVSIPAVMIGQADGQLILDRLQNGQSVAVTLDKRLFVNLPDTGNIMWSESSRGYNTQAPDILKPDVTAPGIDILAAQTPDVANGIRGETFQYLTGTSMAAPHVAGIAALIKEAHPDWTPAMIKSAIMTTARQNVLQENGETLADPFDMGAGHVVPNSAVDPGLVFEAGKSDYEAFRCGLHDPLLTDDECRQIEAVGYPTVATDLNLPSIALSSLVAGRTIKRRVTNVGPAARYNVLIENPRGIEVDVNPPSLMLETGQTADFEITLSANGARLDDWHFGAISWVNGRHTVRSPIAVHLEPFSAPTAIAGSGANGKLSFDVQFGYTGTYTTTVGNLVLPAVLAGTVDDDPFNNYGPETDDGLLPPGIWQSPEPLIVDDSATLLRVALFNEHTDGDDNLDLYVYYCPDGFCFNPYFNVKPDSDEQVDILLPFAGEYFIEVHGFETDEETGGPGATFDLFTWMVGPDTEGPVGELTLSAPAGAVAGNTETLTVEWAELGDGKHLGAITHGDGSKPLEVTVIEIDN